MLPLILAVVTQPPNPAVVHTWAPGAAPSPVDLTELDGDTWRLTGSFTICLTAKLTKEPADKRPLVSRWETVDFGRSWEVGVSDRGRPYLSVSASGKYDKLAKELFATRRFKPGTSYGIAAVFSPGERMALYINGRPSGEFTEGVPGPCHDSESPALLGARPPGALRIPAEIGEVRVYHAALDAAAISAWTEAVGMTAEPEVLDFTQALQRAGEPTVTVRQITHGPKRHWFSYYDKLQVDPTGRYALSMEVDFEGRSPTAEDVIKVGMVDLEDGDKWVELGETRAWCWQQGCMLQWRPGSDSEIVWNDREGDHFVCRVLDVKTRELRTLPHPVYHLNPNGKVALGVDFARVNHMRPGYGYPGVEDRNKDVLAPEHSGLYLLDLDTGERTELFSIADVAAIPYTNPDPAGDKHYFNHIQWSPGGERFLFLHRWRPGGGTAGFETRMLTAAADGTDIRLITDKPGVSHFEWRDPEHICIHRGAYRVYPDDGSGDEETIWEAPNGHQSYLPDKDWVLTDTYPLGKDRQQVLYLLHIPTKRIVLLGRFPQPPEYKGEWRCDLHPRVTHGGRRVIFDSTHTGEGRQLFLIDISDVVADL